MGDNAYTFEPIDTNIPNVYAAIVSIDDLQKVTEEFISIINDQSWMTQLDEGSRRSYEKSVSDTAQILTAIIVQSGQDNSIHSEFGEILVSISAGKALESLLSYIVLPLSELWKPQKRQNEGFDFHTTCPRSLLNYGEAKYLKRSSPHKQALDQIQSFFNDEKHFRDRVYLRDLVSDEIIQNLDDRLYGAIAAFSINAKEPNVVIMNALNNISEEVHDLVQQIYLIGVICEP
ncbi:MAG TPA: hypothetical protein H9889_06320 [Candidatus Ignatzschineria merdigallinarum]|uniref:Uncharacterized protein n=1 Tax=Candidatus Ignatzschineria merdigallinarum TaxID=2838621 RepID=A0A9D1Q530_9GAMM|nr:hypothetical protein [Candidatus Ignatzschineria merdigallinarum]